MDTLLQVLRGIAPGAASLLRLTRWVAGNLKSTLLGVPWTTLPATTTSSLLATLRWTIKFLVQSKERLLPALTLTTTSLREAGTGCLGEEIWESSTPSVLLQLPDPTESALSPLKTALWNTQFQVGRFGDIEFGIGLLAESMSYYTNRTISMVIHPGCSTACDRSCSCWDFRPSPSLRSIMPGLFLIWLTARLCGLSPSIRLGYMAGYLSRCIFAGCGGWTTVAHLALAGICIAPYWTANLPLA
ncbi:hypothetical protein [Beihai mantis shrimp virus 6]|uniref:hypothetical protein n=1 Tax=Beihai mantis shrimp virus 6 TaxID=1922433 RepID=UPI00090BDFCD|nr:hypothetical protein [Beihai mantis shrimp virus 6]APG76168.1 hypothetical protein [Beihai mantis shrimp virus 6]